MLSIKDISRSACARNQKRPHWGMKHCGGGDALMPSDVYVDGLAVEVPVWQGWTKAAKEKLSRWWEVIFSRRLVRRIQWKKWLDGEVGD